MKKFTKKDYFNLLIIVLFVILVYDILISGNYIYGSTTDWKDQHYLLPEYFRNLFYSTGKIIPEFALNIGGGQNIFNFAYYGFLSPIILLSYLFPFIKMMDYIIISTLLTVIISSILIYKWLKNNYFNSNICLLISFIFVTASSILFHSHRHIMFITYMPFLILGLMGIDKYFKSNKFYLITVSVFLMLFTSYFYSVGGIVVLTLYYIYKYLENTKKFVIKDFLISLLKLAYFIFLGILISSIILLPIIYTLITGRGEANVDISLLSLFIPKIDLGYIMYDSYGCGFTSIAIISLIMAYFVKNKNIKILTTMIVPFFVLPLFLYLLNGTLYINSKALIPFIPLICFVISYIIKNILDKKIDLKKVFVVLFLLIFVIYLDGHGRINNDLLKDLFITMLSICLYYKFKNKLILFISISLIAAINCINVNKRDELYTIDDYNFDHNVEIKNSINEIIKDDYNFYRIDNNIAKLSTVNEIYNKNYYQSSLYSSIYNKNYNKFYTSIFENELPYRNSIINAETNNLLFQIFMGEKYIITNHKKNLGYEVIERKQNYSIYENKNVLPIGYSKSKLLSNNEYEKLDYPYNVDALLNYIIVDEEIESNYESNIKEYDINYLLKQIPNDLYKKRNNKYEIKLRQLTKFDIDLDEEVKNKILFISFDMDLSQSCRYGDTYITINGIKNKLTCKSWKYHNNNYKFNYVLAMEDLEKLNIIFSKGNFLISHIKAYLMDYEVLEKLNDDIENYNVNLDDIKTNVITGSVDSKEDSYFIIKIPYDKGFNIYVDGNKSKVLNLNDGFIGTKISSGKHDVKIVYHTPLLFLGKIITIFGIVLFIISIYINRKFNYYKDKFLNLKIVKFCLNMYKKYEEIINYLVMGGCTTVVSIGSYAICSSILGIYYQISNVISWVFAVTFAYITNKLFVFKQKNTENLLYEIYQFIKFRILSLLMDMAVMFLLVDLIHINDIIAKILVQILVVIVNYVFSKLFIFKKKKQ